jgi:predicted transcriptional regulator
MKLRVLNIVISSREQFVSGLKRAMKSSNLLFEEDNSIEFDSFETFKRVMTLNKLQILMAIARMRPESINQLAKLVNRDYPHVLSDCKALETYGFIKLDEIGGARKQLMPKLVFDYDFIRVKTNLEEILPISERSNKILLTAKVANG